jgi:hypothetical protein
MLTAMTYAHSHKAVTTYTAFLESDESPTSTIDASTHNVDHPVIYTKPLQDPEQNTDRYNELCSDI